MYVCTFDVCSYVSYVCNNTELCASVAILIVGND